MKERNIGLGDAYKLVNNAPIDKRSNAIDWEDIKNKYYIYCLLYTSPSPRDPT